MGEQILVQPYNGISLNNHKKWMFETCHNMDGTQGHYDEWNKPEKDNYSVISFNSEILKKKKKR